MGSTGKFSCQWSGKLFFGSHANFRRWLTSICFCGLSSIKWEGLIVITSRLRLLDCQLLPYMWIKVPATQEKWNHKLIGHQRSKKNTEEEIVGNSELSFDMQQETFNTNRLKGDSKNEISQPETAKVLQLPDLFFDTRNRINIGARDDIRFHQSWRTHR